MSLLNKLGNVSLSAVEGAIISLIDPVYLRQTLKREKEDLDKNESISVNPERIAEFLGYTAASLAYLEMIAQNPSNPWAYVPVVTNTLGAIIGLGGPVQDYYDCIQNEETD